MEDFSRVKYFSGSRGWERETVSPRSGYFLRLHSSYRGKAGGRYKNILLYVHARFFFDSVHMSFAEVSGLRFIGKLRPIKSDLLRIYSARC